MHRMVTAAVCVAALAGAAPAQETGGDAGAPDRLAVELNKLEPFDGGCRSFFLFRNRSALTFSAFEMSLAILDTSGVIDRLLTIDVAPLPTARTTLKIFEIPEMTCDAIGEIILHDIPACMSAVEGGGGAEADCFGVTDLSSRASAPLAR